MCKRIVDVLLALFSGDKKDNSKSMPLKTDCTKSFHTEAERADSAAKEEDIRPMRLKAGCTKFPNMAAGQIGFAAKRSDAVCLEPRYKYKNGDATGYIHTRNHDELRKLCEQIGAMTKDEFIRYIKPIKSWKNNYIVYLDKKIAKALSTTGIRLPIEVKFCTENNCCEPTDIKSTSALLSPMRLEAGCTKFPNMGAGQIGFAARRDDAVCLEPRYKYENGDATGYIHTVNHDDLRDLCRQIGAMTKNEFMLHYKIRPNKPWKNNYIVYLDSKIAKALSITGIILPIEVEFYTEPGCYNPTDRKPTKAFIEQFGDMLHEDK